MKDREYEVTTEEYGAEIVYAQSAEQAKIKAVKTLREMCGLRKKQWPLGIKAKLTWLAKLEIELEKESK